MAGMGLFFWGGTEVLLPYPGYIKEFSAPLAQMHAPFPCITAQAVPIPQVHPQVVQCHKTNKKLTTKNKLMLYLVVYDIASDTHRLRLARLLEQFGMERVQYSAFRGNLHPADVDVLKKKLKKYISGERDCIFLIPLCRRCSTSAFTVSTTGVELVEKSRVHFA